MCLHVFYSTITEKCSNQLGVLPRPAKTACNVLQKPQQISVEMMLLLAGAFFSQAPACRQELVLPDDTRCSGA